MDRPTRTLFLALGFAVFGLAPAAAYDKAYDELFPTYIEYATGTRVKPVLSDEGGIGGHAVVFIRGICKDETVPFPRVKLCDPLEKQKFPHDGVGISVDRNFKNANWVAIPGYDFLMNGSHVTGTPLDHDTMVKTYALAEEMKIFEGVTLHEGALPAYVTKENYTKELIKSAISTDFAVGYGRTVRKLRVPVAATKLSTMVEFLNKTNEPYLKGTAEFAWSMYTNNCAHLSSELFEIAGVRKAIPKQLPMPDQLFHLAIPGNGLITLQNETNFRNINPGHILDHDPELMNSILKDGDLPIGAGSISEKQFVIPDNHFYRTNLDRLILPPKPICNLPWSMWNTFRSVHDARFLEIGENLKYWAAKYRSALDQAIVYNCRNPGCEAFIQKYTHVLEREIKHTDGLIEKITGLLDTK